MAKKTGLKKKRRTVKAVVVVPPDAAAVEVAVVLPAPTAEPPNLSWQTKGKRLLIRIKNVVMKELGP